MEKAARQNILLTAVLLTIVGAGITVLLYRFYTPEKPLFSPAAISAILLLSLIFLLYRKAERIAEHPFFSWILVSAYVITGILLCFPNNYVYEYNLFYIVIVVVAGFTGLSFACMMLLGMFLVLAMINGITVESILFAAITLITMLNVASDSEKGDFIRQTVGTYAIEAVMVLLTGNFLNKPDTHIKGMLILIIYLLVTVIVYIIRSNNVLVWSAFNYSLFDEEEKPAEVVQEEEEILREYTIAELCNLDTVYYKKLKARFPKTCERDTKTGLYARKVAGYAGADIELVQCACTYRNLQKLADNEADKVAFVKGLMIPENLRTVLVRENDRDFRPANFEEIVAYAAHETVSAYVYFKKQKPDVNVQDIVESVCTLLLRKGIVRDCLLSMSLFHRMKQGLCDYFAEFFEEKE